MTEQPKRQYLIQDGVRAKYGDNIVEFDNTVIGPITLVDHDLFEYALRRAVANRPKSTKTKSSFCGSLLGLLRDRL